MVDTLRGSYEALREEVEIACQRAGRKPEEVRLMAVTKTQPRESVEALYHLGHRLFGENRVQEAREKLSGLPEDAEVHLIGHLQSNKAAEATRLFSWIQSLDKLSTAQVLDTQAVRQNKTLDVLLELNTSEEESKEGVRSWEDLIALAEGILTLSHLRIRGLMTIAPFTNEEFPLRASFRKLKAAQVRLETALPQARWDVLSMGMSNDFSTAIQEGSTLVRIGTRLFGARPAP